MVTCILDFIKTVGKPYGLGQYIWKNGSTYSGEFKNGLKHGQGKWRKNKDHEAHQYDGQYIDDKKEGYGIFKWASGNIYRGMYKNDEREGIGEMRWTDGSVYLGQWHRGIQHGYGKMIFPDGTIKEGYYENNIYMENHQVNESEIPSELKDKHFTITKLDPVGKAEEIKLPSINKPDMSLDLSIGKKQKSEILKQLERNRVGKSSIGSRMQRNLTKKLDYKTTEISNHIRSSTSSHTNKTLDVSSNANKSVDGKRRKLKVVRKKKAPYWLPSGGKQSFNKLMKFKMKIRKKA